MTAAWANELEKVAHPVWVCLAAAHAVAHVVVVVVVWRRAVDPRRRSVEGHCGAWSKGRA